MLGRPNIDALNPVQIVERIQSDDSKRIEKDIRACLKVWESWKENSEQN